MRQGSSESSSSSSPMAHCRAFVYTRSWYLKGTMPHPLSFSVSAFTHLLPPKRRSM